MAKDFLKELSLTQLQKYFKKKYDLAVYKKYEDLENNRIRIEVCYNCEIGPYYINIDVFEGPDIITVFDDPKKASYSRKRSWVNFMYSIFEEEYKKEYLSYVLKDASRIFD